MATKKKKKRETRITNSVLNDDELKFFYEKILLFYENDNKKKYGDFDKIKKKVKKTQGLETYDFIYDDYKKEMKYPQDNIFYFSAAEKGKKCSKICKKLFGHIRNAFAHNYITKEGEYIILRDYENPNLSSAQTLYAKLYSFESFKTLIEKIQEDMSNK